MTLAYLILLHQQPKHLGRMIRALDAGGVQFFIHVDGKADIGPFRRAAGPGPNIHFLEGRRRTNVFWSGFSSITAILNLLEAASSAGTQFSRYCLLSGSDFPIKGAATIREELRSEIEFMRVDRRLDPQGQDLHSRRIRGWHFYDHRLMNPRTTPAPRWLERAESLIRRVPRRPYRGIPLYQGSAWWALTHDSVAHILKFVRGNPEYAAFHRHVGVPDECFFQSILKASPFRGNIVQDFERNPGDIAERPYDHASHFIDWITPGIELPKILDLTDADRLAGSRALFARKFGQPRSDDLLRLLEERIAGGPTAPAP